MMEVREQSVGMNDDGARLDRFCKRHWPDVPHGLVQKSARKGLLRVDGRKVQPDARVSAGQIVTLRGATEQTRVARAPLRMTPQEVLKLQHRILHDREAFLVIDKPAGLAVQGGSGTEKHLDGMLDALQGPYAERPKLVHRLDRDTSGVLLLARNAKSAATLSKAFAGRDVHKVYWALVLGWPTKPRGVIDIALSKGREGNAMERMLADEDGLPAETHYRVIERVMGPGEQKMAWLELMPVTGRTHQLRAHLLAINHPIFGDGKYGGIRPGVTGLTQQLHLHARRLVAEFPGMAKLDVKAPLPPHMQESWEILGWPKDDLGVSLLEVGVT